MGILKTVVIQAGGIGVRFGGNVIPPHALLRAAGSPPAQRATHQEQFWAATFPLWRFTSSAPVCQLPNRIINDG
jgi:hypothetical protein